MYYYRDCDGGLQGPYPEQTLEKWFERKALPSGTILVDEFQENQYRIEEIVTKRMKRHTKVMFRNDTTFMDETNLDVTLDINDETYQPNDSTMFCPDFTQISDGVDEVDLCGKGAESDTKKASLQREVHTYIAQRALLDRRRRFPDNFVPFEFGWNDSWVTEPLSLHEACRGAVHQHNLLQEMPVKLFSSYLHFINIHPHLCSLCHVDFETSFEMLLHFCSVVHVQRLYNSGQCISLIDVLCVQQMISDVNVENERSARFDRITVDRETHYLDEADVFAAIESFRGTVTLMQSAPLLREPRKLDAICGKIEAITLFQNFENELDSTLHVFRNRRLGVGKVHCAYCNVNLDGQLFGNIPQHILSEQHIHNALSIGISRSDMEYWFSFFEAMRNGQSLERNALRYQQSKQSSLQELDFPLCCKLEQLPEGDFKYHGAHVEPVLNEMRQKVRDEWITVADTSYRTECRWCRVELYSVHGVLSHVLYERQHLRQLNEVSNDDLRRFLKMLNLTSTIPMFKASTSNLQRPLHPMEKTIAMQQLCNVLYRAHKRDQMPKIVEKSFPMGLVNYCDLCGVHIEHVKGIDDHFLTEKHKANVMSSRISESDVDYWMHILNVPRSARGTRCR